MKNNKDATNKDAKNNDRTREAGTVARAYVEEGDRGIQTVWVHIGFPSGQQGFGGIHLGLAPHNPLVRSFVRDLCEAFDVDDIKKLEGKACYALRCFNHFSDFIEGIVEAELAKDHGPDSFGGSDF